MGEKRPLFVRFASREKRCYLYLVIQLAILLASALVRVAELADALA
jgi:hypothetical protein